MNEPTLGDILAAAIRRRDAVEHIQIPQIGIRINDSDRVFLKNSIRKFYDGSKMNNREVQTVLNNFAAAYNALRYLGERFDIVRESLLRDILKLEGWARSRNDRGRR